MKKELVKGVLAVRGFAIKNSPTILSGLAISGLITSLIWTHDAAIKAYKKIEEEGLEKESFQEKAKATWKFYAPPVLMATASIACIAGSNVISLKRTAAITSLYTVTDSALREYKAKTAETFGESKAEKMEEEAANVALQKKGWANMSVIRGEGGDTLCIDSFSGRAFTSDIETIRSAVNTLRGRLFADMRVTLNDLYYELGIPGIWPGDELGWTVEEPIELSYDSQLNSYGVPCLVIRYKTRPMDIRGY